MRNLTEHNMTEAVLARLDQCEDPRLKQILSLLAKHLHGFVREAELTEAEWMQGIEFLTATGQMCNDKRRKFILLSDTLGVSMLTVALNNAKPSAATEATVCGPFHVQGAPEVELGADIGAGAASEPLFLDVTVKALDGTSVPGAVIDMWQADEQGTYDVQYRDSDMVFGVRSSLVGDYVSHPPGRAPHGAIMDRPFHTLRFDFVLNPSANNLSGATA